MNALRPTAVLAALTFLLVACGGTGATWTYAPPSERASTTAPATPSTTAQPTPAPTAPPATIAVTLTDLMRIEPMAMEVRAGVPTTFIVTNAGKIVHEFTLGDADTQAEHEQEMIEMGGMGMTSDEHNAISVAPGETKELVFTFEMRGMSFAGCHVMGHYPAGMKATISVL